MTAPKEPAPARGATRAPIDRPVRLQFEDGSEVVEGRSHDVSIGGMFVGEVGSRERGVQVRFELLLEDEVSIRGLAEVVWSQDSASGGRQAGVGLKFKFLEQRDRQQIFRLVSQHIKERLAREGPSATPSSLFEESASPDPEKEAEAAGVDIPPSGPSEGPAPGGGASPQGALFAEAPAETGGPTAGDGGAAGRPARESAEAPIPPMSEQTASPRGRKGIWKVAVPLLAALLAVGAWFLLGPDEPTTPATPPSSPASGGDGSTDGSATPAEATGGAEEPAPVPPPESENGEEGAADVSRSEPGGSPEPSPPPRVAPPPPRPTEEPLPPPSPSAEAGAFSRLVDVRWRRDGEDVILVLETDGRVEEGRFKYFRIEGESPREVVRLLGVGEPYGPSEAASEVEPVARVRFGYHPKESGDELHVVLDLADPGWELVQIAPRGNRLEGVLRRR